MYIYVCVYIYIFVYTYMYRYGWFGVWGVGLVINKGICCIEGKFPYSQAGTHKNPLGPFHVVLGALKQTLAQADYVKRKKTWLIFRVT